MKLHTHPALFQQAIRFTSDRKEIPEIYIEKDYWVTYALKQIFSDPGQGVENSSQFLNNYFPGKGVTLQRF
ncbi:MAG: hypothetical protein AAGN35_12980 [Bacteroidota bacterium]